LEEGNSISGIYGIGSAGKRFLAGGFAKRFRLSL
jgi:hypothetical protein